MANRRKRRANKKISELPKADQTDNIIKTFIIVVLVFVVFYLITIFIINRKQEKNNDNLETIIQYQEILAGETFNQLENEYYVIFYDFSNYDAIIYDYMIDRFRGHNDDIPLYKVDLDKGFNAPYLSENSNQIVNQASALRVKEPTLIKIKDGQNILYQDEKEAIYSILMP